MRRAPTECRASTLATAARPTPQRPQVSPTSPDRTLYCRLPLRERAADRRSRRFSARRKHSRRTSRRLSRWRKVGLSYASGTTISCAIVKPSSPRSLPARVFRGEECPHPAGLRPATFSPREKGALTSETSVNLVAQGQSGESADWRPSMETGRNLLAGETSPYLLQHAHNPVHWRPWGTAALEEAKRRDCPILLSIGYAACHWCHVMAHESFEDQETARLMNDLFVSIKVDREERPDIDHIYMTALHALGQQGGWPLTMFLDPEGKPMFGGTYWPPAPRFGRPSFRQVLAGVAAAWRDRRPEMTQNGAALAGHLAKLSAPSPGRALNARRPRQCRRRALARGRSRSTAACAARRNSPTRRSSASSGTRCSGAAIRRSASGPRPASRR